MTTAATFAAIPTVASGSAAATKKTQTPEQLKLDFLKLLTTQLQYQDPLSPTSNTEFTSQMAQFSSLDAQNQGNTLLQQLLAAQGGGAMNQAVAYMGKQVVVPGNQVDVHKGAATVRFDMPEGAESVTVDLFNPLGAAVGQTTLQGVSAGEQSAVLSNVAGSDGVYSFAVSYLGSDGSRKMATPLMSSPVTGVINNGSGVMLDLNGQQVALTDVRRVELAKSAG
ncbi:MAG: hypothetical protein H7837_00445 [Magnetococcus sp. MYC-9]